MPVPGCVPGLEQRDGEAVVRREIHIPKAGPGRPEAGAGTVDDFDVTFWNGVKIGGIGAENPMALEHVARLHRAGPSGKGGSQRAGGAALGSLRRRRPVLGRRRHDAASRRGAEPLLYHPDYRTDFILGDDPFRYKRW
jgi:hypothetical protein